MESSALEVLLGAFSQTPDKTPVQLVPSCCLCGKSRLSAELSFTIGASRQYVVQDVKKLVESVVYNRKIFFGKDFVLDYRQQRCTPLSRALFQFLAALYRDALQTLSTQSALDALFSVKTLRLGSMVVRRFFELMKDEPFVLRVGKSKCPRAVVRREKPLLVLHLRDVGCGGMALYLGEKMVRAITEDCEYILFASEKIYRVDSQCA